MHTHDEWRSDLVNGSHTSLDRKQCTSISSGIVKGTASPWQLSLSDWYSWVRILNTYYGSVCPCTVKAYVMFAEGNGSSWPIKGQETTDCMWSRMGACGHLEAVGDRDHQCRVPELQRLRPHLILIEFIWCMLTGDIECVNSYPEYIILRWSDYSLKLFIIPNCLSQCEFEHGNRFWSKTLMPTNVLDNFIVHSLETIIPARLWLMTKWHSTKT